MRADIHDGPEHILQSETEYIDARLHQPASTNPLAARGRTIHWGHFRLKLMVAPSLDVRFSNRPFEVKHFQTIRHCNVDVAHGLALLFGIGTKALPKAADIAGGFRRSIT